MKDGTEEERRYSREVAARVRAIEGLTEKEQMRLSLMMLDGAFDAKEFTAAVDVLKQGVPGRDEQWHAALIGKISAHIALSEDRHDDAVKLFRQYMDFVKTWEESETNPETGQLMSKEAVLGFNEKRIGDILTAAGEQGKARAAYKRALKYYKQALEAVESGSKDYSDIEAEMKAVPVVE
jgi:predicted negative regulator of RcsB-dependent stress response